MGDKTKIQWTDATWGPLRGCSKVSAGCSRCYAESMASRFSGPGQPYEGTIHNGRWNGVIRVVPEHLTDPLRWKRPRRVFVNSMSDLFHENVPDEVIDDVFGVMAVARAHTFQALTKRSARMRDYLSMDRRAQWANAAARLSTIGDTGADRIANGQRALRNVHIGVSVEDERVRDRILDLAAVRAAVRFLSVEPMIGPLDLGLEGILPKEITGGSYEPLSARLGWVIVGGESGPGARPCQIEWIRAVVEACRANGVPCFVKQLGAVVDAPDPFSTNRSGFRLGEQVWDRIGTTDRWRVRLRHPKGGDPDEWPEDLRVREFPS